jgi:hypothetical protein
LSYGSGEKSYFEDFRESNSIIFVRNTHNSLRLILNGVVVLAHIRSKLLMGQLFDVRLQGANSEFYEIHLNQGNGTKVQKERMAK